MKQWAPDVASLTLGATIVDASNQFYSDPINLLLPHRADDMRSGWESARSRDPTHTDWVIVQLACRAALQSLELDTAHFRGNFPFEWQLHYSDDPLTTPADELTWMPLVSKRRGRGHFRCVLHFEAKPTAQFVRLQVIPDGGVSRLRVLGLPISLP